METLSANAKISEKFLNALSILDMPWIEISKSKLRNSNWRDSMSIWGKLSKFIFKMNRLTLRRKVMLFWYQNTDKIKEQVNSCHSSTEIIDKELILIVSIDLSKLLGANSTPIHHQMDEFSAIQKMSISILS